MTDLPARIRTLIDDLCGPAWPPSGELRVALEALHDIADSLGPDEQCPVPDCHGLYCLTQRRIAAAVEQIEGG